MTTAPSKGRYGALADHVVRRRTDAEQSMGATIVRQEAELVRLRRELNRERSTVAILTRVDGLPNDAADTVKRLKAALLDLWDDADPVGAGRADSNGNGSPRRRFDQPEPGRTAAERRADQAARRLLRSVDSAINDAFGSRDAAPSDQPQRAECPKGCRNNKGQPIRQGNGHIYCPKCTAPFKEASRVVG